MSAVAALEADDQNAGLQATLDGQRDHLQAAGQQAVTRRWLRSSLRTQDGTQDLLAQLGQHIAQDSFLAQLERNAAAAPPHLPGGAHHEVLSSEWWSVTDVGTTESEVRPEAAAAARTSCRIPTLTPQL